MIAGAWYGISAESVLVPDVTISNHVEAAITGQRWVVLRNATLSGNRVGVDFEGRLRLSVRAYDSTITGNARFGIVGRRMVLCDSTVTGNGFIPGCDQCLVIIPSAPRIRYFARLPTHNARDPNWASAGG